MSHRRSFFGDLQVLIHTAIGTLLGALLLGLLLIAFLIFLLVAAFFLPATVYNAVLLSPGARCSAEQLSSNPLAWAGSAMFWGVIAGAVALARKRWGRATSASAYVGVLGLVGFVLFFIYQVHEDVWGPGPVASVASTLAASSGPIVVSQTSVGGPLTVNDAIRTATPGTRILVRPGTYNETLLLNKDVEIVGGGATGEVILEGDGTCILMEADRATVRGFTIRGMAGPEPTPVVGVTRGQLVLEDCDVSATGDHQRGAVIMVADSGDPIVQRCAVNGGAYGVAVYGNGKGTFENCAVTDNSYGVFIAETGVRDTAPDKPLFRGCEIARNQHWGVSVKSRGEVKIIDCDLQANGDGSVFCETGSSVWSRGVRDRGEQRYIDGHWLVGP